MSLFQLSEFFGFVISIARIENEIVIKIRLMGDMMM